MPRQDTMDPERLERISGEMAYTDPDRQEGQKGQAEQAEQAEQTNYAKLTSMAPDDLALILTELTAFFPPWCTHHDYKCRRVCYDCAVKWLNSTEWEAHADRPWYEQAELDRAAQYMLDVKAKEAKETREADADSKAEQE